MISAACLIVIDLNGEMRYLDQTRTASDIASCSSKAKATDFNRPIPTYLPVVTKFAIYGASRGPGSEYIFFTHTCF